MLIPGVFTPSLQSLLIEWRARRYDASFFSWSSAELSLNAIQAKAVNMTASEAHQFRIMISTWLADSDRPKEIKPKL